MVNLYDFSKVSPSDFLQSDLFQKNNKKIQEYLQYQTVWSNVCWTLFVRNVKSDLDPKLFWLTPVDEELTGFFIFAVFYLF